MFQANPRVREFLIKFALITVLNVIIAVILTYLMHIGSSFRVNLVISMCIGWLSVIFIDGTRLMFWGAEKLPRLATISGIWLVSIPSAQYLGNAVASRILGIPPENIEAVRAQNSTGLLILTVLVCIFISFMFRNRMRLQRLRVEAESQKARAASIEKEAMQAQLQLLQAQIEPHMLFNTLANLQGLITLDPARAQLMLDQLIQYLRATLSSSRTERTTLKHEFSLMDAYLGLMSVRMGRRLSYTLQLPDALHNRPIPPMLLQPLIENAIRHGLEPKLEGGCVDVAALEENDMLLLTVTDTGLGLAGTKNNMTAGTHVGLTNVRKRLQALYGEQAWFTLIPNAPCGAIARIIIPLSS